MFNHLNLSPVFFEEANPNPADDGGGGGGPVVDDPPEDWRSSLPDELKSDKTLSSVNSVADLAKGYVHAQKAVGNNVAVPTKDASEEEWGQFFQKVGRPEAADKYDFSKLKAPEGVEIPEEAANTFRETAHKLGLSQRQAAGLMDYYQQISGKALETGQQAEKEYRREAEDSLRKEFGSAVDERLNAAKEAVKHFGGEEALEELDSTGLGNNPTLIKMFAKIGKAMENDELFGAGQEVNSGAMTPSEAESELNEIQANKEDMDAYWNPDNPRHESVAKKMKELMEYASGNKK